MGNVVDYLHWRGDLPFSQNRFNDVDALILAMLSYLPFKGIVPGVNEKAKVSLKETAQRYFSEHPSHKDDPENIELTVSSSMDEGLMQLLKMASQSARFGDMHLSRYQEKTDFDAGQQFAALTFSLPNIKRHKVIAFRGTDNTLIGWKEDFEMAYMQEIPAQESARNYLKRATGFFSGRVSICGHSKGGNLAVYAASCLNRMERTRVSRIINFDGPGFNFSLHPSSSFSHSKAKVVNYVPEESVVGMLMGTVGRREVITSTAKAIYQHNPISWEVKRKEFNPGDLSETAKWLEQTLETWLAELSIEKRKAFIDALFDILGASEGKIIDPKEGLKDINQMIKKFANLDEETRKMLFEVFTSITSQAKDTISKAIKEKLSPDK